MSEHIQRDICEAAVEILRNTSGLAEATIIVEDRSDVDFEIKKVRPGVVIAVASTGHVRRRGSGPSLSGEVSLEILCSEIPKVNRAGGRQDFLSAQGAAELVAKALHRAAAAGATLVYDDMHRQDEDNRDQVYVTLHAEGSLDPEGALAWGLADGTQAYGEITRLVTRDLATCVFEDGSDGAARWYGVRDRGYAVDVTADIPSGTVSVPAIGDTFKCPLRGVQTSFICTASELTEDVEETSSIHLTGRTITDTAD